MSDTSSNGGVVGHVNQYLGWDLDDLRKEKDTLNARLDAFAKERDDIRKSTDPIDFKKEQLEDLKKRETSEKPGILEELRLVQLALQAASKVAADPAVSIRGERKAILQQSKTLLFHIHNINNTNNTISAYEGTGFFLTETTAVTAKHVLQSHIKEKKGEDGTISYYIEPHFIKCSFVGQNTSSTFHMEVLYISETFDFVTLRLPSNKARIVNKLDFLQLKPLPFLYDSPDLGPCYTLASHQIVFSKTHIESGIHVEPGDITLVVTNGAVFSGDLYPGDSGSAVVMRNGKLVGMFVQMFTGLPHSQMPHSPTEQMNRKLQTYQKETLETQHTLIEATVAMMDSLHQTTSELNKFKSKHNYFIDINIILPYAKEI